MGLPFDTLIQLRNLWSPHTLSIDESNLATIAFPGDKNSTLTILLSKELKLLTAIAGSTVNFYFSSNEDKCITFVLIIGYLKIIFMFRKIIYPEVITIIRFRR